MCILGLDFGGVISKGHTTDGFMPGLVEELARVRYRFSTVWIVSRVDSTDSMGRILEYMDGNNLWTNLNIPKGNVVFCLRRKDKAPIVNGLGITSFVDDHTEVLNHMVSVRNKYALCTSEQELNMHPPDSNTKVCSSWYDLTRKMEMV